MMINATTHPNLIAYCDESTLDLLTHTLPDAAIDSLEAAMQTIESTMITLHGMHPGLAHALMTDLSSIHDNARDLCDIEHSITSIPN